MTIQELSVHPTAQSHLLRARSRLERRGLIDEAQLNRAVAQSWKRCLAAQLDPLDRPGELVEENASFGRILREHSVLRKLARPELDLLFGQVSGSNYLLALGTPDGVVTDVLADSSFLDTEAGRAVIAGSIWREEVRGTNAMGLTLHDLAPRGVWRGEHFYRSQGQVSCLSVPIFDSSGALAGVLDASTGSEDWHPHTMALLTMSAANIEAGLFHYEQEAQTILRVHPRAEYLPTMSAGLIAVDQDGRIRSISRRGQKILRLGERQAPQSLDELFVEGMGDIIPDLRRHGTIACRLVGGGVTFLASTHLRMRRPGPIGQVTPVGPISARREATVAQARPFEGFVASDLTLRRQLTAAERVLRHCPAIHISGESGTGKESLARYLHAMAGKSGPFETVHCAGIGEENADAALLALSDAGASGSSAGLVGASAGGTVFLRDVGELPMRAQGLLLELLDHIAASNAALRKGTHADSVQIISASEETLANACRRGALRHDLFYRLNGFAIRLPQLRLRTDLDELCDTHLAETAPDMTFDPLAREALRNHDWSGNIRELRSVLTIAVALADGPVLQKQDILGALQSGMDTEPEGDALPTSKVMPCSNCRNSPLRRQRCIHMRETYLTEDRNAARTARKLGIARSTLYQHLHGMVAN